MNIELVVRHVDEYRAFSRAIRLVAGLKSDDLKLKARITHHLYEAGHTHWLVLLNLPVEQFGRAFELSRAKG